MQAAQIWDIHYYKWPGGKPGRLPALGLCPPPLQATSVTQPVACLDCHQNVSANHSCQERERERRWARLCMEGTGKRRDREPGVLGCAGASPQPLSRFCSAFVLSRETFHFLYIFMLQPPENLPPWALLLSCRASGTEALKTAPPPRPYQHHG